jgi:hypothetical protein
MNRTDVAYLINTTPKYFYMLSLHLNLLQRYAPELKWPVYLATEVSEHPEILSLKEAFPALNIIPLTQEEEPFLESRLAATRKLPESIKYVFPIQEDFLLEGRPIEQVLENGLLIMDQSAPVASLRLMPCPGPVGTQRFKDSKWRILGKEDSLIFTFQATIWRRERYAEYLEAVVKEIPEGLSQKQKVEIQIKQNIAENHTGQKILRLTQASHVHLAWPREGSWPNAVYLAPWPYRPTAIVQGKLQQWARDLAEREGVPLAASASS